MKIPRLGERAVRHSNVLKAIRLAQNIYPSDLEKLLAKAIDEVPATLPWFEVVGVPERYGLPADPGDLMGGLYAVARAMKASVGAHDGIIEYPGHLFPKAIAKRVVIPTSGTHTLAEGAWEGMDLDRSETRRILFRSLVETAIEANP